MAVTFVDYSRADDTGDGLSWEAAKKTLQAGLTAAGSAGTCYVADTHNETTDSAATLTFPAGVKVYSSDVLSGTSVSYKLPTEAQFKQTTTSTLDLTITNSGNASVYGLWLEAMDDILTLGGGVGLTGYYEDCVFELSSSTTGNITTGAGLTYLKNCTIKLNDTGTTAVIPIQNAQGAMLIIENLTWAGTLTYRNTHVISNTAGDLATVIVNGMDTSGMTAMASGDYLVAKNATEPDVIMLHGVKVDTGVGMFGALDASYTYPINIATCYNGNPWDLYHETYLGSTLAQTSITRDNGASINSQRVGWTVVTTANAGMHLPYMTPWMHVNVPSTGSKTFTVYIGNASADLKDTEVWLEVEYMGTSSSVVTKLSNDRNADILASGTAQTDDTTSDWDTDLTYMQTLAVTATVETAGAVRARVIVGKASTTLYVDPTVTVS